MVTIIFKGQFETSNHEIFINKIEEILKETDSTFVGRIDAYETPEYVDFQEVKITDESNNKSKTATDTAD